MGLIATMTDWLAPKALGEAEREAIEQIIERVDPRLRVVSGYQRKLAPAVRTTLEYCNTLVAAIPGPIDIDIRAFGNDPLVHAMFAAPEDIGRMLGTSREVSKFIAVPENLRADDFYALIGMRRKEKTIVGPALQGEFVREGVPQRLLYFADHTLRDLSLDVEKTRCGLCDSAVASLAGSFALHLEALRREKVDIHLAWEQERAQARTIAAQAATEAEAHAHRRFEMEEGLREIASTLEPAHVLEALSAWLSDPAPRLRLVSTSVAVDRLGVLSQPAADNPEVQTLNFPELVGRDRRRWIVLLTRISREDALRAQEAHREANRYLII
ncbi:MAG: hypothetical protein PHY45_04605 [Rhodocyclaceae bacterium]|nr:hypothetical protein [Rhodocyclaceae bacterium]